MTQLKGFQRKYLRGLAHSLNPMVLIGQHGLNESVMASLKEAINSHELIKVKFNAFKEKEEKIQLTGVMEKETGAEMVGMVGHVAIFYKAHKTPDKRKIKVPKK